MPAALKSSSITLKIGHRGEFATTGGTASVKAMFDWIPVGRSVTPFWVSVPQLLENFSGLLSESAASRTWLATLPGRPRIAPSAPSFWALSTN